VNAIVLVAYGIGNAAGPFMWKARYKPRNRVPFTIIAVCSFVSGITLLVIRWYFVRENKKREQEEPDHTYDDVCVIMVDEDGKNAEKKVDKAFLDLTDLQNRDFRYDL